MQALEDRKTTALPKPDPTPASTGAQKALISTEILFQKVKNKK